MGHAGVVARGLQLVHQGLELVILGLGGLLVGEGAVEMGKDAAHLQVLHVLEDGHVLHSYVLLYNYLVTSSVQTKIS